MCIIEGCTNKHEAHGYCKPHYNKKVRDGEIITIRGRGRPKMYTEEERLQKARDRSKAKYYNKVGYSKGCAPSKPKKTDTPGYNLWANAKTRAKEKDLPINISLEDIVIPEVCPLLGIPIIKGIGNYSDNSPTLDRIVPDLGYVIGNIWVISMRANRIKDNSLFSEFETMYNNWKRLINK